MPRRTKEIVLRDFTGGLNTATPTDQIARNEMAECVDFDIDVDGGLSSRRGIRTYAATPAGNQIQSMYDFRPASFSEQLVVWQYGAPGTLSYSTGGAFTVIAGTTFTTPPVMAQFKDLLLLNTATVAASWTGAVYTAHAQAFNDDLTAPAANAMIKATEMVTHQGYLFVGNTTEAGTNFPNRLRWSHPNQPRDWRTNDFIDFDPGDGDAILGLIPQGERLIVLKARSVWALYGYSPDTFQRVQLAKGIGAASHWASCYGDGAVYFYDENKAIYRITGDGISVISEKIRDLLEVEGASISATNPLFMPCLSYGGIHRRRLFFTYKDPAGVLANSYMLVYFPDIDAWTRYSVVFQQAITFQNQLIAPPATGGAGYIDVIDSTASPLGQDSILGAAPVTFTPLMMTPWITDSKPLIKKRWRRVTLVLRNSDVNIDVNVRSYRNFDSVTILQNTTVTVAGSGADGFRDVNLQYSWPGVGIGKRVRLRIFGSGVFSSRPWGIDEIHITYTPPESRALG